VLSVAQRIQRVQRVLAEAQWRAAEVQRRAEEEVRRAKEALNTLELEQLEEPEEGPRWICRVSTCDKNFHPLKRCPLFRQLATAERW
jgi:hypothetical protein